MTQAEALLQDFDLIVSNTTRTLERVPDEQSDFKAHERSVPLGRLAMHAATMPIFGIYVIEDEGLDQTNRSRPRPDLTFHSHEQCLRHLSDNAAQLRAAIVESDDPHLEALWCFRAGEQVILNKSRAFTIRFLVMDHLIHHVAQLGLYFRLLGIPVPALYGPSGDEKY